MNLIELNFQNQKSKNISIKIKKNQSKQKLFITFLPLMKSCFFIDEVNFCQEIEFCAFDRI